MFFNKNNKIFMDGNYVLMENVVLKMVLREYSGF